MASLWELALKASSGRLEFPQPASAYLARQAANNKVELVPIELRHIAQAESLPFYHRDPFDRMLVAQAMVEDLVLLTIDRQLGRYGVPVIW